jgi:hypothetical protein
VACDTAQRGWTKVTLTPKTATGQWRFVSSVVDPTYATEQGLEFVARVGQARLDAGSA